MGNTPPSIMLFVYGTLKRGGRYHARFCRRAVQIRPATVLGRLYDLDAGYPTLEIPADSILAHGTADPVADAELARRRVDRPPAAVPDGGNRWETVHGELMTFANPSRDIPPIDRLEAFRPDDADNLYLRVLAWVRVDSVQVPAWLYTASPPLLEKAHHIPSGHWPVTSGRD